MDKIITGNLVEERKKNPPKRGWFIGHFLEKNSVFKTDDFEAKWAVHPKGEKKTPAAASMTAKTISILIKGKFAVRYPKQGRKVILSKPGDFVFHDAKIPHTSEAIAKSTMLTIRWPSVPGDQKTVDK